jgi:hypothetical protein
MNIAEFKNALGAHPQKNIRFVFPDGDLIEPDFHVTEVGHIVKNFVDCGGTRRKVESCLLQTWVAANDKEHRLSAGKLSGILDLANSLLPSPELEVEIEYEGCTISQYPLESVKVEGDELHFIMTGKHTDCLAKEACGLESNSSCCGTGGCS